MDEGSLPAEDRLSPELAEDLSLLDNSQGLIRTIFLGLAMQYRSLDLWRRQLLAQPDDPQVCPEPEAVQIAASLITLCALFGFWRQSEQLAFQEAREGGCPDMTDVKLSATMILIALIRLARLQAAWQRPLPQSAPEELIQQEELDQPVL